MRLRDKGFGIAILLLAFAACEEDTSPQPEDEAPEFDDDATATEDGGDDDEGAEVDAGMSPRRDATIPAQDASAADAARDASREEDVAQPDAGPGVSDAGSTSQGTCAGTEEWTSAWTDFEVEVLRLTNEARAAGHNCDTKGTFGKAEPLTMEPRLRCAARLFSKQMAQTNTFSHTGADGSTLERRLDAAGYTRRSTWGENIAKNQQTPAEVVAGWLESDGHCANIMNPKYTEIGVGLYSIAATSPKQRATMLWTQDFARAR